MYVLQIHNINVQCTLLSCIPLTWLKSVLNDNRSCKHVPCVKIMAFLFLIFLVNRYMNLDDHLNNDQYTKKKRKQPLRNDLMILFLWSLIYIQYRDKHFITQWLKWQIWNLSPVTITLEMKPKLENVILKLTPKSMFIRVLPFPVDNLECNVLKS